MQQTLLKFDELAVLTTAEVVALERRTIQAGKTLQVLMQAAGEAVFREVVASHSPVPTLVLCGPGNNGGDGRIVASLLQQAGWPAKVAASPPKDISEYKIIIDGLFGTGLSRDLAGEYQAIIDAANASSATRIAIDIPSGVNSDTGEIMGTAFKADLTITLGCRKPGLLLFPGRNYVGQLKVANIGLSKIEDANIFVNRPRLWKQHFPIPSFEDYKFKRGNILIRGGSELTGAARLASTAARRIGAGIVTICSAPEVRDIYALSSPGILTIVENDFGKLLSDKPRSAVLLGPGNGVDAATKAVVLAALAVSVPCVLDADALTVFQDKPSELFRAIQGPCVLTPHEGEFARIFDIKGDKISRARTAAKQSGAVVLIKGADTVIAHPDGVTAVIQDHAPPYLATAGTGDVLSGTITGLLGQGMDPFIATCMAAWINGEAANYLGFGLIAEDLPSMFSKVVNLGIVRDTSC